MRRSASARRFCYVIHNICFHEEIREKTSIQFGWNNILFEAMTVTAYVFRSITLQTIRVSVFWIQCYQNIWFVSCIICIRYYTWMSLVSLICLLSQKNNKRIEISSALRVKKTTTTKNKQKQNKTKTKQNKTKQKQQQQKQQQKTKHTKKKNKKNDNNNKKKTKKNKKKQQKKKNKKKKNNNKKNNKQTNKQKKKTRKSMHLVRRTIRFSSDINLIPTLISIYICNWPAFISSSSYPPTQLYLQYMGRLMRKCVFGHMRTAKPQIWMYELRKKVRMILCACAGWSKSVAFAHVRGQIFVWGGQYRSDRWTKQTLYRWKKKAFMQCAFCACSKANFRLRRPVS